MDLRDVFDEVETIKDVMIRPGYTVRKKTIVAYGTAILTTGTLCANLYTEPTLVAPCETPSVPVHTVPGSSGVMPLSSVLVAFVSS